MGLKNGSRYVVTTTVNGVQLPDYSFDSIICSKEYLNKLVRTYTMVVIYNMESEDIAKINVARVLSPEVDIIIDIFRVSMDDTEVRYNELVYTKIGKAIMSETSTEDNPVDVSIYEGSPDTKRPVNKVSFAIFDESARNPLNTKGIINMFALGTNVSDLMVYGFGLNANPKLGLAMAEPDNKSSFDIYIPPSHFLQMMDYVENESGGIYHTPYNFYIEDDIFYINDYSPDGIKMKELDEYVIQVTYPQDTAYTLGRGDTSMGREIVVGSDCLRIDGRTKKKLSVKVSTHSGLTVSDNTSENTLFAEVHQGGASSIWTESKPYVINAIRISVPNTPLFKVKPTSTFNIVDKMVAGKYRVRSMNYYLSRDGLVTELDLISVKYE